MNAGPPFVIIFQMPLYWVAKPVNLTDPRTLKEWPKSTTKMKKRSSTKGMLYNGLGGACPVIVQSTGVRSYVFAVMVLTFLASCNASPGANGDTDSNPTLANTSIDSLNFSVEEAADWTALFNRTSGWFGGDGIFAIPLDAKENQQATASSETLFIFSDTMIGNIKDGKLQEGSSMVNNSVAYLKGNSPDDNKINFQWAEKDNKPATLFVPSTPTAKAGDYYWLGDGFMNPSNKTSYVFAYRMHNMDSGDDWSFKEVATDIIAIPAGSRPPFAEQRQIETPLRFEDGGFGAGIFANTKEAGVPNPDGYVYVYGNRKGLMVARVQPDKFEDFTAWRFWDGKEWVANMNEVITVAADVSNELSVSALPDGRFALVFTKGGLSTTVGLRLARTPYGPFGPIIPLYETKEMEHKNYITYNAKAHPSLSAPGELLISYNVNAFHFMDELRANPSLYRPRFIKVKVH